MLYNWRHFSHIAKFFQIWSTVAGYDEVWDFSQSETEKYLNELHHYHSSSSDIIINNNPIEDGLDMRW